MNGAEKIYLTAGAIGGFMLFVRVVPLWFSAAIAFAGCVWLLRQKR